MIKRALLLIASCGAVIALSSSADAHRQGGAFFGFSTGPAYPYYAPPPVYYPRPYYPPPVYYAPPPTYYVPPPRPYYPPPAYYAPPQFYYGPRPGGW